MKPPSIFLGGFAMPGIEPCAEHLSIPCRAPTDRVLGADKLGKQKKPASEETGLSEPRPGIDPGTSILPRWRSTTELSGRSGGRARSVDLTIMSRAL